MSDPTNDEEVVVVAPTTTETETPATEAPEADVPEATPATEETPAA